MERNQIPNVETVDSSGLTVLSLDNGDAMTNRYDTANTFNK